MLFNLYVSAFRPIKHSILEIFTCKFVCISISYVQKYVPKKCENLAIGAKF